MKVTNMEHFRSEIEEMMARHKNCLPAVVDGKPVECMGTRCDKCMLYEATEYCSINFIKWLLSEYKPEPVLTEKEMRFMEFVQRGWLARDADGDLFWHGGKPEKNFNSWHNFEMKYSKVNSYDGEIFHFITWEDEEPWSVEELRKLKVQDAD